MNKKTIFTMLLLMLPGIVALGNHLNIEFDSGVVTINTSIITGTNISCNNVIGASYDVCLGDGDGATGIINGSNANLNKLNIVQTCLFDSVNCTNNITQINSTCGSINMFGATFLMGSSC